MVIVPNHITLEMANIIKLLLTTIEIIMSKRNLFKTEETQTTPVAVARAKVIKDPV